MAVSLLANEVSDLCIGKPAVRSLPLSAAAGDLAAALRRGPPQGGAAASSVAIVAGPPSARAVAGRLGLADVLCFLCAAPGALAHPAAALSTPVSALLPKDGAGEARRVDPRASVLDALDAVLSGAQVLAVPLRSGGRKKQLAGGGGVGVAGGDFCWLTQEDLVRYFLNSISIFSHVAGRSVSSLGLIRGAANADADSGGLLTVRPHEAAMSTVPLLRRAIATETAVAVVDDDGHLVGELSPALLASCHDEAAAATAAAAVATLSVADLMSYIDYCGCSPPEHIVRAIKAGLKSKGLDAMLELVENETASSFSFSSSSSSSASSSDDEAHGRAAQRLRRRPSSGSYGRRSTEEPVVCSPASSLVAVMMQALAHRASYLWVLDEDDDCRLAGIVTFADVLRVFREQLQ